MNKPDYEGALTKSNRSRFAILQLLGRADFENRFCDMDHRTVSSVPIEHGIFAFVSPTSPLDSLLAGFLPPLQAEIFELSAYLQRQ
jgi:hypothetical protein